MVFGKRSTGAGGEPALLMVKDRKRGSLEIGHDETVVLLGPSGAGKSTWLRSAVGLGPDFDEVRLLGQPFTRQRLATTVGWVPQSDGVFLSETVWQNVYAPKYVEPCRKDWAVDAIDWVGLAERAMEPVVHLDWAAKRRVALARAVARRRPLLIIDGELDKTLWPMFPALCSQFPWLHGVLVATATAEELAWRADAVALVDDGKILVQAPLAHLVDSLDPGIRSVLAWTTP